MGVLAGILGMIAMARIIWHTKFYPNVMIGNVNVGGMKRDEAKELLEKTLATSQIRINYNGYSWSDGVDVLSINIDESINRAYRIGRRMDIRDYFLVFIAKPQIFPLVINEGTTDKYAKLVEEIAQVVEIPSVAAEVKLNRGKAQIINGSDGVGIDKTKLESLVKSRVSMINGDDITLPITNHTSQLRSEEQERIVNLAEKLADKNLTLVLDDESIKLGGAELISFLETEPGMENPFDPNLIKTYVEGVAESLSRDPIDGKFGFENGKVTEFAPSKDGLKVDTMKTQEGLSSALQELAQTEEKKLMLQISVTRTKPSITIDKLNELGINERIGRGESYYAHSIPNRIFNVGLASSRINSALIPPGEEVSFNKLVGEVSAATGYRSAYIISQGRTVLGDGGGLCQVSTTLFRAAMNAGLPILERWGHSYRVSYYELNSKPGVDATVIAPSKDFRFKNDTPGHILIQTTNDPKSLHLVIEIYGTSDGRVATVTEPKVWGITPPLPTVYQDDPSLPAGTMKQVDWSAGGAKASFEYKVTRNGETLQEQTFSTVYRPWAAVYLRGTGQ